MRRRLSSARRLRQYCGGEDLNACGCLFRNQIGLMGLNEAGVEISRAERRVFQDGREEREVGVDPCQPRFP